MLSPNTLDPRSPLTHREFPVTHPMNFALRTLVATVVLFFLEAARHISWGEAASALLVCTVLCWIAVRSRAAGAELVATLAGFYFLLISVNTIPEGVLFDVIKVGQSPLMMVEQSGIGLAIACVIAVLFRPAREKPKVAPEAGLTIFGLLWRLVAAMVVFAVCYLVAGMLIFPLVKSYYASRTMPGLGAIAAAQVLRVLVLILAAWLVLRIVPKRRDARMILTVAFPVIGVLSLMLHPNEIMPPAVRWVHTMEMVPYYALFGFLLSTWFGPRRADCSARIAESGVLAPCDSDESTSIARNASSSGTKR